MSTLHSCIFNLVYILLIFDNTTVVASNVTQVSWVKSKDADSDILTVGQYIFVNDERFSVFLSTDTWTLVIKFVQERDSGIYECQISTEPKMALKFRLNVIGE